MYIVSTYMQIQARVTQMVASQNSKLHPSISGVVYTSSILLLSVSGGQNSLSGGRRILTMPNYIVVWAEPWGLD